MDFSVGVELIDGWAVIAVSGELSLEPGKNSPVEHSERAVDDALGRADAGLIFDMSELQFIDSTGLSVLVKGHQRCRGEELGFRLVGGSDQVQRLLKLTGLSDRMEVFADRAAALAAPR